MKIVIVDDEKIIVSWLKKNIETISGDYQVAEVCSNGKQALLYCLNNPVDVLFTDIRMPVMDGIALMGALKEQQRLPYTILLTAYDDFDYARQALQLGAREFLLKTEITEQSLKQSLNEASQNIAVRTEPASDPLIEVLTEMAKTETLTDGLAQSFVWKQSVFIILIEPEDCNQLSRCVDMLGYVYTQENLSFKSVLIDNTTMMLFSAAPNDAKRFVDSCVSTMQSFGLSWNYMASASSLNHGDIFSVIKKAKEEISYYRYYQTSEPAELLTHQKDRLTKLEDDIFDLIKIDNYKFALQKIEEWLLSVQQLRPEIIYVHSVAMRFLLLLFWDKIPKEQRENLSVEKVAGILRAEQFAVFTVSFLERIKDLIALLPNDIENSCSPVVAKVMLHIKANYAQPLTLDDIAATVHLNRSYLSTLFKKETGMNLFEFLQGYRIDMAKQLLCQKRESIQQICEQVGLPDSAYFSKLFKKHEGITPHEYRKQLSKN